MEVKRDINTGEIYEEVSNEEFKEIMLAWTARKVSDECQRRPETAMKRSG